jgi:hypothetical protein
VGGVGLVVSCGWWWVGSSTYYVVEVEMGCESTNYAPFYFQRDELGYSALHHASIAGLRDVVDVLIEGGEDVDGKGQDGATPLRYPTHHPESQFAFMIMPCPGVLFRRVMLKW